jgi:23S rRNA (cytidine1920-2'-O)/16S rRNA (cytidine1409-2'-O)-methyltransferase
MTARDRLDRVLVARGLVQSRERARALIMAGKVEVAGQVVSKAGAMVAADADVRMRQEDHPYVSRGALKLIAGLDAFGLDPTGWVAMDVGASTGGFTDVLLRRGAARVYAIDVGYGQLAWQLRQDERVRVIERENIRTLAAERVPEPCDAAVIDVSFISLTLVLPRVAALMKAPDRPIVALVKPQFEVGKGEVGKGGVVREATLRAAAVDRVKHVARDRGFRVGDVVESPITGPAGNVEYVLLLHTPAVVPAIDDAPPDAGRAG